jgi:hypothetical protein
MKVIAYFLAALLAVSAGFWSYQENYRTRASLKDLAQLQHRIGVAHARMDMLKAEWAYLNRPDRLRQLADMNFKRLGLLPMMPSSFGNIADVSFPPEVLPPIMSSTEIVKFVVDSDEPL